MGSLVVHILAIYHQLTSLFICLLHQTVDQVAKEIWIVEDGAVEEWDGDIRDYKEFLRENLGAVPDE